MRYIGVVLPSLQLDLETSHHQQRVERLLFLYNIVMLSFIDDVIIVILL